jgi:hypothetical protein
LPGSFSSRGFADVEARMSAPKPIVLTAEQRAWLDAQIAAIVYGTPISDEAIADILNCLGPDYVPSDLDREQLKKDIDGAWRFFKEIGRFEKGQRTSMRKYALGVQKAAEALSNVLDQSNWEANRFRYSQVMFNVFPLNDFRLRLRHLQKIAADFLAIYSSPVTPRRLFFKVSSKYWFLGHDLRLVFEKHFRRPSERGLFIPFAIKVSAALGLRVSEPTVSRAMTAVALGKNKPRKGDWFVDEFGVLTRKLENS